MAVDVTVQLLLSLAKTLSLVVVGYILRRRDIIHADEPRAFNNLLRLINLPCIFIVSVLRLDLTQLNWAFVGVVAAAKVIVSLLTFLVFYLSTTEKKMRLESHSKVMKESVLHALSSTTGNEIAIGMPLILDLMPTFFPLLVMGFVVSLCIISPVAFAVLEVIKRHERTTSVREGGRAKVGRVINASKEGEGGRELFELEPPSFSSKSNSEKEEGGAEPKSNIRGIAYTVFDAAVIQSPAFPAVLLALLVSGVLYSTSTGDVQSHLAFQFFDSLFEMASNGFGMVALVSLGASGVGFSKRVTKHDLPTLVGMTVWKGCATAVVLIGLALLLPSAEDKYFISSANDTVKSVGDVRTDLVVYSGLYGATPVAIVLNLFARQYGVAEDVSSVLIVVSTLFSAVWMTFLIIASRQNAMSATLTSLSAVAHTANALSLCMCALLAVAIAVAVRKRQRWFVLPLPPFPHLQMRGALAACACTSGVAAVVHSVSVGMYADKMQAAVVLKGVSSALHFAAFGLVLYLALQTKGRRVFARAALSVACVCGVGAIVEACLYSSSAAAVMEVCTAMTKAWSEVRGSDSEVVHVGFHLFVPANASFNGDLRCTPMHSPTPFSSLVFNAVQLCLIISYLSLSFFRLRRTLTPPPPPSPPTAVSVPSAAASAGGGGGKGGEERRKEEESSSMAAAQHREGGTPPFFLSSTVFASTAAEAVMGTLSLSLFFDVLALVGVRVIGPLTFFYAFLLILRTIAVPALALLVFVRHP